MTITGKSAGYNVEMLTSGGLFFFFKDTATTEIYTLSLHDALPIRATQHPGVVIRDPVPPGHAAHDGKGIRRHHLVEQRSEEHTSELQSLTNLVCRLLLEKKNYYPSSVIF